MGEMDLSIWVHQNIIRLSREFGIEFQGCSKEILVLIKKIDGRRQSNFDQLDTRVMQTPKITFLESFDHRR